MYFCRWKNITQFKIMISERDIHKNVPQKPDVSYFILTVPFIKQLLYKNLTAKRHVPWPECGHFYKLQ